MVIVPLSIGLIIQVMDIVRELLSGAIPAGKIMK